VGVSVGACGGIGGGIETITRSVTMKLTGMRIVARLLVLLSLLWVESVSADAEETANQLAYKREAVGGG